MNITLDDIFEISNFNPNPQQRQAIEHVNGPLLIAAGPGSGKTRVLLYRTLNLIVFHHVEPSEIFLSTFTEKGALQLKDGLKHLLAKVTDMSGTVYDISLMSVGTVHSLCSRILQDRRFTDSLERQRAPKLLDQLDQYFRLFNRHYWASLLESGGFEDSMEEYGRINYWFKGKKSQSRHNATLNVIAFFNRLSEENVEEKQCVYGEDKLLMGLFNMYWRYREDLRKSGDVEKVDFALLQQSAYRYLCDSDKASRIYKHVIIDEYQDTNTIQELIFFRIAKGHGNLCVVGDDDQALYRFRGATVENLVRFESRAISNLGLVPKRVDLNINYRSRKQIVHTSLKFIQMIDWHDSDYPQICYRFEDKNLKPFSTDNGKSVVVTQRGKLDEVCAEIASVILKLRDRGTISDYNQVAVLFPSIKGWNGGKNIRVEAYRNAFYAADIPYYAPRSGRFLEVDESLAFFGVCKKVFGETHNKDVQGQLPLPEKYVEWLEKCDEFVESLMKSDDNLAQFIEKRRREVQNASSDHTILLNHCSSLHLEISSLVGTEIPRNLLKVEGLTSRTIKALSSPYLVANMVQRENQEKPYTLAYLLNRVTALDWTLLDLFYQVSAFEYFKKAFDLAQCGEDEGPVCNMANITQYLSRYMAERGPIITGKTLIEDRFIHSFFYHFLYGLFRYGEQEYEDKEVPFPKGRVSFLTIHQAKGLEFPVVILGNAYRGDYGASKEEETIRSITDRGGEPLDRISKFDTMRLFYVALSRAQNLLILPRFTNRNSMNNEFYGLLKDGALPTIRELDIGTLPNASIVQDKIGKSYSYTRDYISYLKCPRNYMLFNKYSFVPSRGQSMFFGRLVHETIEDLHLMVSGLVGEGSNE